MLSSTILTGLLGATFALAAPLLPRVTIDQAATAQAQQRDDTATRAITASEIKTSDGLCLSVDPNEGDFRENLIPVKAATCNGTGNQKWDAITAGKHNNQPGNALFVNSLTNGCLNFDDRKPQGSQVFLFSCGGRADGDGETTDSQLFPFDGTKTALPLTPKNSKGKVCFTVKGNLLDQTACDGNAQDQLFTIGGAAQDEGANGGGNQNQTDTQPPANPNSGSACPPPSTTTVTVTPSATGAVGTPNIESTCSTPTSTVTVTVSATGAAGVESSTQVSGAAASASATKVTQGTASQTVSASKPTGTTKLDQKATEEAQQRDDTATRALTSVQVKSSDGQCLGVDPNAGDFRGNLIPIAVGACDGSPGQRFDVITAGKHNDQDGAVLLVSSLTNACLNVDQRRNPGNQVIMFSCGGRADGSGQVTDSQLFKFDAGKKNDPIALSPLNAKASCMINKNGLLDITQCDNAQDQLFSFVA